MKPVMSRLTLPGNNETNVLDVNVNECGLASSWSANTSMNMRQDSAWGRVGRRMNDPHDRLWPGGLGGPESRPFPMSRRIPQSLPVVRNSHLLKDEETPERASIYDCGCCCCWWCFQMSGLTNESSIGRRPRDRQRLLRSVGSGEGGRRRACARRRSRHGEHWEARRPAGGPLCPIRKSVGG